MPNALYEVAKPGAIDRSRPILNNPDGTFSTENTITIEIDGKYHLIPTIVGGRQLSGDEAILSLMKGENRPVGTFNSQSEASAYAKQRSAEIGRVRGPEAQKQGGFQEVFLQDRNELLQFPADMPDDEIQRIIDRDIYGKSSAVDNMGQLAKIAKTEFIQGTGDIASALASDLRSAQRGLGDVEQRLQGAAAQENALMGARAKMLGQPEPAPAVPVGMPERRAPMMQQQIEEYGQAANALTQYAEGLPKPPGPVYSEDQFLKRLGEDIIRGVSRSATGIAATWVAPPASFPVIWQQIKGASYRNKIDQGYDEKIAAEAAGLEAAFSSPLEFAGNLIDKAVFKGSLGAILEAGRIPQKAAAVLKNVMKGMVGEGAEEYSQAYAEELSDVYAANYSKSPEEIAKIWAKNVASAEFQNKAGYSGLVGAGSGGAFATTGAAVGAAGKALKGRDQATEPPPSTTPPTDPIADMTQAVISDVAEGRVTADELREARGNIPDTDPRAQAIDRFFAQQPPAPPPSRGEAPARQAEVTPQVVRRTPEERQRMIEMQTGGPTEVPESPPMTEQRRRELRQRDIDNLWSQYQDQIGDGTIESKRDLIDQMRADARESGARIPNPEIKKLADRVWAIAKRSERNPEIERVKAAVDMGVNPYSNRPDEARNLSEWDARLRETRDSWVQPYPPEERDVAPPEEIRALEAKKRKAAEFARIERELNRPKGQRQRIEIVSEEEARFGARPRKPEEVLRTSPVNIEGVSPYAGSTGKGTEAAGQPERADRGAAEPVRLRGTAPERMAPGAREERLAPAGEQARPVEEERPAAVAKPESDRSDREIERWTKTITSQGEKGIERLRSYVGSLVLGRDYDEKAETYFERKGLTKFVEWARDQKATPKPAPTAEALADLPLAELDKLPPEQRVKVMFPEMSDADAKAAAGELQAKVEKETARVKGQQKAKEPWEMTRDEWASSHKAEKMPYGKWRVTFPKSSKDNDTIEFPVSKTDDPIGFVLKNYNFHSDVVRYAVRKGKPVPTSVLKDYPDLAKTQEAEPQPKEKAPDWAQPGTSKTVNGETFWQGRLGLGKGKWAHETLSGGYRDTIEEADASYRKQSEQREEARAHGEAVDDAAERVKSGDYTDADIKTLTGMGMLASTGRAESILRTMGMRATDARGIVKHSREVDTTSGGAILYDVKDVVERARRKGFLPSKDKSDVKPAKTAPKPPAAKPESKVTTLRGAIHKMGGLRIGNMKGEFKELPTGAKFLLKKTGEPLDLAEQRLKEEGWLRDDESLAMVLRDPLNMRRGKVAGEGVEKREQDKTENEKKIERDMAREPEAPPEGDYITLDAEDLPEGKKLTIIDDSAEGWDVYEVTDKDPFGVTLRDGRTVELRPGQQVQVRKEDLPEKAADDENGEKAILAGLKAKGFDGTIDLYKRGKITLEDAKNSLEGKGLKVPDPKPLNPADVAAEMKAAGIGRQESWSRWVQRTALKPGMDAKDWYGIYDSVTAAAPKEPVKTEKPNLTLQGERQMAKGMAEMRTRGKKQKGAEQGGLEFGRPETPEALALTGERAGAKEALSAKKIMGGLSEKGESVTLPEENEFVQSDEINKWERSNYFDEEGQTASSRKQPMKPYPWGEGTWKIDKHFGPYGRMVEQIRSVAVSDLSLSEEDYTKVNYEGRGFDAEQYAEWIKDGKTPPPVLVVEADSGQPLVSDGHRRVAAAKLAGLDSILAWVSPRMDTGKKDSAGKPIYTAATYEGLKYGAKRAQQMYEERLDEQMRQAREKETPAEKKAKPGELDDFGEKLGGARKDLQQSITKEISDADIASTPFSEIWPKSDVDSIEDKDLAAVAHAIRSEVPAKPRKSYALARWVERVKMVRGLMVHAQSRGVDSILKLMAEQSATLGDFAHKIRLLQQIDREQWGRIGAVRNHPDAYRYDKDGKQFKSPYATAEVDNRNVFSNSFDNLVKAVKTKLDGERVENAMQFEIRYSRKDGNTFINKKGDPLYRPLKKFGSAEEARAYLKDNRAELAKAWEELKERENVKETDVRRAENRPRTGKDHRNGKDATPEMFMESFGFRGVEFGNWVSQGKNAKERQGMLNESYDALMDLADLIGVDTRALSLNGTLGLGLGSRGSGWASAHFEPDTIVINLTKTRGAGALAHEFFHALDNYFQRQRPNFSLRNRESSYVTHNPEAQYVNQKTGHTLPVARFNEIKERGRFNDIDDWKRVEGIRPEVEQAFADLVKALNDSPMKKRAALIDKGKSSGYWSRTLERAARAFENYVIAKMQEKGYQNDYLANVAQIQEFSRDQGRYPYLLDSELKPVAEAFDNLFATIQTKETDKGVAMFSKEQSRERKVFNEIKSRSKTDFEKWLKENYSGDELREILGDKEAYDSELEYWLESEHSIRVDENGYVEFWDMDSKKRRYIGDLPVKVYHYTSDKIAEKVKKEGLRAGVKDVNRHGYKLHGVYVTTETSGPAVEGYGRVAANVFGGNETVFTIVTQLKRLRPDPNDADIQSGRFQYYLPDVSPDHILEVRNSKDEIVFSKGRPYRGARPGLAKDTVDRFLQPIAGRWMNGPAVKVVQHQHELPDNILAYMRRIGAENDIIRGVFHKERVYLVADNFIDAPDAFRTLVHETFGHYGIKRMLGDEWQPIMEQIYRSKSDAVNRVAKEYDIDLSTEKGKSRAAEEWLAREAELNPTSSIVERVVAAIRRWLRRLGLDLKMSDGEIKDLLARSREYVQAGRPANVFKIMGQAAFAKKDQGPGAVWYSQMERVLEQKLPGKGNPKAIAGVLESWAKKGEFKAEELEWSGVIDWLKDNPAATITKADVLDWLAANNVRVQEVVKGAQPFEGWTEDDLRSHYADLMDGEIAPSEWGSDRLKKEIMELEDEDFNQQNDDDVPAFGPERSPNLSIPGGENYRELLLTLPEKPLTGKEGPAGWATTDNSRSREGDQNFRSSHYQEPNILAHVRFNERTDADGKRLLFIEEVQSDWHQLGRKRGYIDTAKRAAISKELDKYGVSATGDTNLDTLRKAGVPGELQDRWFKEYIQGGLAPNAPFKTSWPMLAMKRMVRYASENGFDAVAWTTGEQQAERYDLGKQVDSINAQKTVDGIYSIQAMKDGQILVDRNDLRENQLAELVGKDLAEKIVAMEVKKYEDFAEKEFTGLDLKVGGEGMKGFYDKILPAEVNKFFGKAAWGNARVGEAVINSKGVDYQVLDETGHSAGVFNSREAALEQIRSIEKDTGEKLRIVEHPTGKSGATVHSLPITDAMREKAMGGMPLFAKERAKTYLDRLNEIAETRQAKAAEVKRINDATDLSDRKIVKKHGHSLLGSLHKVFGPGYKRTDMKLLQTILTPDMAGEFRPQSTGKIMEKENDAHEERARILSQDYQRFGINEVQKFFKKNPRKLQELENLIWDGVGPWEGEGNPFPKKAVPTQPFTQPDDVLDDMTINDQHYEELRAFLDSQNVDPDVADAFVKLRRLLDKKLLDIDHTLRRSIDDPDTELIKKFRSEIAAMPAYFPHMREGDSYVAIIDKETNEAVYSRHYFWKMDKVTPKQHKAETIMREWMRDSIAKGKLKKDPVAYEIKKGSVKKLPDEVFFQIPAEALQQIADAAGRNLDKNSATGKKDYNVAISQAMAEIIKSRGFARHAMHRSGLPGFEQNDIFMTLFHYLSGYAGFKTKMERASHHSEVLRSINAAKNPREYRYNSNLVRDLLANSDKLDRTVDTIRSLWFFKFLGFNPKSAIVNLTQNPIVAAQVLSMHTKFAGPKLTKAGADVRDTLLKFESYVGKPIDFKSLPKDERNMLRELTEGGIVLDQFMSELIGDIPGVNRVTQFYKNMVHASAAPTRAAERFNRASTALAAYRIARDEKKMGFDDSVKFAKKMVRWSHFTYGKHNLPPMFRGGPVRKLMRAAYTFQSYKWSYWSTMAHLFFNQGPRGRRAVMRSLPMYAIIGGLKSFPFFTAMAATMMWALGNDDEDAMTKIRESVPTGMRDLATYGLAGAAGVDISGSLTFDMPQGWKDLIGVPASVVDDAWNMVESWKSGQYLRAIAESPATPMFVKNAIMGAIYYTYGQHTRSGRPINAPGEVGPRKIDEVDLMKKVALGFQPVEISKGYAQHRALDKALDKVNATRKSLSDRFVNAMIRNDTDGQNRVITEVVAWNERMVSEGKPHMLIDLKQGIVSRLRQPIQTVPKSMRGNALRMTEAWQ